MFYRINNKLVEINKNKFLTSKDYNNYIIEMLSLSTNKITANIKNSDAYLNKSYDRINDIFN
jgi:hypothetical protein